MVARYFIVGNEPYMGRGGGRDFCFYLPVCEHVYTRHSTEIDGELREGSE